jgi:hypothetical protein
MKTTASFFLLLNSFISFSQLTYVPDDALEGYFETLFIGASNGSQDNYVLTAGLQQPGNSFGWQQGFATLFGTLNDLTGLQDCKYLDAIIFQDVSPSVIDLSTLNNGTPFLFAALNCNSLTSINLSNVHVANTFSQLSVDGCNQLAQINLPMCNVSDFMIKDCPLISSVIFPSGSKIVGPANVLLQNNISLTNFDLSNAIINGGCDLYLGDNQNLNCVNLKGGYCNMITPHLSYNPFVFCVQVDNVNYSNTAWSNLSGQNWLEQWYFNANNPGNTNNPYTYSTNCNCATSVFENENISELSIFPNPASTYITVKNRTDLPFGYIIIDIQGKKLMSGKANSFEKIDIGLLNSGCYFLHTDVNDEVIKFVISD